MEHYGSPRKARWVAVYGHRNQMIFLDGDFLFTDSSKLVKVRDRSDLAASAKKLELVPQEEIREALITAIRAAFSLSEEDAISEALSMLGFQTWAFYLLSTHPKGLSSIQLGKLLGITQRTAWYLGHRIRET